ncbi:PLP-dependent aminotransferase family protein [Bosea robiniae]|uniref:GntR family transcriptional regulator / MocR family aminotransferase n=1 Tax=Bosea robiniae TaxID=1036780 RepID=A0ABY0NT79_9HYPH|nr:PLP-dependent aminotransferase family protein [Bosea robiniae]SDF88202.1 GntR family transcriptional regulator / MocR family aminotransferase [Bosea robiniae]
MVQLEGQGIARRIIAAIKQRIHGGEYHPGDRLPSSRALALEWGVSRTTVTAAYAQLIGEGYLLNRPGARAVVARGLAAAPIPKVAAPASERTLSDFAERLLALPAPARFQTYRVADLRYGDLNGADFPMLPWRRALNRASLRRTERLRYSDPQGSAPLRAALQSYLWRARGISCAPEQIVVVNGSQQGLDLCARLLLNPSDRFVMEDPGYVLARHAFAAAGGVAVPVAVDREGIRTDGLPAARLAYVTPSHQYPLGSVLSAARRRALLDWAVEAGAVIVEDDYDGEYRHGVAPIPPLQTSAPDTVIYLGTVSKTLSPTLRLGYLVVPPDLCGVFAEAKRLTDRHTPLLEQEALAEFLASGGYERHIRSIRRRNAERRAALLQALATECGSRLTVAGADTGLHVVAWLNGVPAEREASIVEAARAAGIGLYPIGPLYASPLERPAEAGFVIGYAAHDVDVIRRGIAGLAEVFAAAG